MLEVVDAILYRGCEFNSIFIHAVLGRMSATVTRSTVWFYAGDQPYIDLEIKGTQFFIPFDRTLRFLRPTNSKAIYPDGDKRAEEDGMDLRVYKSSWWIVTDMGCETASQISCTWSKLRGFEVYYWNSRTSTQISFKVTKKECDEILAAVEKMMLQTIVDTEGRVETEAVSIFNPAHVVLKYRVKPILYKHKGPKLPVLSEFAPALEKAHMGRPKKSG